MPAVVTAEEIGSGATTAPQETSSPEDLHGRACRGQMVIVLLGGRRVIVGTDVDVVALRRVLDVLERR